MPDHIDDLLSAYIDNELTEAEREQVEEHIFHCLDCAAMLTDLMDMKQQVFSIFHAIEAPHSLEDKVIQSIGSPALAEKSRQRYWFLVPLLSLVLLMAVVVALTGTIAFKVTSFGFKVIIHLLYVFGGFMGSDPYTITGLTLFSLLIIIGSSVSLKRLLKSNAI